MWNFNKGIKSQYIIYDTSKLPIAIFLRENNHQTDHTSLTSSSVVLNEGKLFFRNMKGKKTIGGTRRNVVRHTAVLIISAGPP